MRIQVHQDSLVIKWITKIENSIVVVLLFTILLFSVSQIFLRNFFDYGLVWGDSLLRVLVLWLGLVGAIVATREHKQISIDVLSQFIPDKYKSLIYRMNALFASVVCFIVSYFSYVFVADEYGMSVYVFGKVPAWIAEAIIPVGFCLLGIRYLYYLIDNRQKERI